jgi:bla regulator protein BlaR1
MLSWSLLSIVLMGFALQAGGPAGQVQAAEPAGFDVESVKPSAAGVGAMSGFMDRAGEVYGQNVTLKRSIMGAYGLGPNRIVGLPDWADSERFEIVGKTSPAVGSDRELMVLLQGLLADRFKLVTHVEERTLPAYALEVGKHGSRMAATNGVTHHHVPDAGPETYEQADGVTTERIAELLSRKLDRPVVDRTGLAGRYDINLHWNPKWAADAEDGGVSVFTAVEEQLGLELRSRRLPVSILVVDHVERPSPN